MQRRHCRKCAFCFIVNKQNKRGHVIVEIFAVDEFLRLIAMYKIRHNHGSVSQFCIQRRCSHKIPINYNGRTMVSPKWTSSAGSFCSTATAHYYNYSVREQFIFGDIFYSIDPFIGHSEIVVLIFRWADFVINNFNANELRENLVSWLRNRHSRLILT